VKNKEAISHHAKGGQFSMQVVALAGRESFGGVEFALRVESRWSRFALVALRAGRASRWSRFALVALVGVALAGCASRWLESQKVFRDTLEKYLTMS
jgi:hypothetical protein